jgi:hypothetical protein
MEIISDDSRCDRSVDEIETPEADQKSERGFATLYFTLAVFRAMDVGGDYFYFMEAKFSSDDMRTAFIVISIMYPAIHYIILALSVIKLVGTKNHDLKCLN